MLEQQTIQQGMHLAEQWGWIGTAIVLYVLCQTIYAVYSNLIVRRKAFLPLEKLIKELEGRVTYEWVERQFDKYQLKEVADAHAKGIDKRLGHIESLLHEINRKLK